MTINNIYLSEYERMWLEHMFKKDFLYRDQMVNQINHSKIEHKYFGNLISLKFSADRKISPMDIYIRVPLEMRVYKKSKPPIQFLLHVINGYINELEIFYADSSCIEDEFKILYDDSTEVIFNE